MLNHRIRTPFLDARERFLFIHWLLLLALSTMHQNYHQIMKQNGNNKKTNKHRERLEPNHGGRGPGLGLGRPGQLRQNYVIHLRGFQDLLLIARRRFHRFSLLLLFLFPLDLLIHNHKLKFLSNMHTNVKWEPEREREDRNVRESRPSLHNVRIYTGAQIRLDYNPLEVRNI